ncbi:MAG: hypothetical protein A3F72_19780 [Bacteroidetes bacterium RIFCSPLOWO2_12_FULL_35_15]|nr:MAG: hypothetical protein A3F72_19780 [Bacteroidetes bacterium RIFCSPLOWO2_12_FULL_35_15]
MNKRDYFYTLLILVLCVCLRNSCIQSDSFEKMYKASSDTLKQTRNELGQQKTTTTLLYGSVKSFKNLHAIDSSALAKVQKMVDKLTISATYLATITGNNIKTSTGIVLIHDTIKGKDGISYVYPEYSTHYENKWERFIVIANKDTTKVDYKVFNEFELVQDWKRNGLFKRKTANSYRTQSESSYGNKRVSNFYGQRR